MPMQDGTGPVGQGQGTGRGMGGCCENVDTPAMGCGRGMGRRGCGRRGQGSGMGRGRGACMVPAQAPTKEQEISFVERQIEGLKARLIALKGE